ncbi:MAG: tRNA uridine-5-carboxymethylaminomethyl(34) synthesis GTPase MnmE [Marinifilaceae bacterium]|nr:tRNA uridine-5-carboxymethylaminomethyl(34) synthesis GTPase MnmE [Marinifilaceae bacterium]
MTSQDTICAIASSQGAIAVIRISGVKCFEIIEKIFKPFKAKNIQEQKGNTVHFGTIQNEDQIIDEVLLSIFKNPNSYTGEDSIEISCHASRFIQQSILQLIIANGARLANPGEFTQRAYLNGKMDLSQAEAVADLIASSSAASHRIALNQMRGGFSDKIADLRNELLQFISLIELELDFSEEDVEFADRTRLNNLVENIKQHIEKLVKSFSYGNAIKNGVPVAIVGKTNAGKSTLLNSLLNEEKAIVSDIAGTTRDVIEDTCIIEGINFRFIDTAGIRETTDTIENLGIQRTFENIDKAQIVLLLIDSSDSIEEVKESVRIVENKIDLDNQSFVLCYNKIDKIEYTSNLEDISDHDYVLISAKENKNIEQLSSKLVEVVDAKQWDDQDVIVSNARHFEALSTALESIQRVSDGLESSIPTDFIAQDIRECLHYLGEITGDISTDEVLGNIFKNFCIGK